MVYISESNSVLDYFVACTPILISGLVAWIGWQQWKTSKEKVRLDIYERRFSVYESTLVFYQAVMSPTESMPLAALLAARENFIKSHRESQFLFNPDDGIFKILDEFRLQSNHLVWLAKNTSDQESSRELKLEMLKKVPDAMLFLEKALVELEHRMAPYLNFHKVLS